MTDTNRAFSDSDEPILQRVKRTIPPVDHIIKALQIEQDTGERIHKLMLIIHAGLVEASEQANQTMTDSSDAIEAHADLISSQRASMEQMERFADLQSGAQTIAQNQDIWFAEDVPSIRHVLEIVNLAKVTEAARSMKLTRVAEIVDALLSATETK